MAQIDAVERDTNRHLANLSHEEMRRAFVAEQAERRAQMIEANLTIERVMQALPGIVERSEAVLIVAAFRGGPASILRLGPILPNMLRRAWYEMAELEVEKALEGCTMDRIEPIEIAAAHAFHRSRLVAEANHG
ncbi:hypothetical protein PIN31009_01871 [Pandoraea iniqua]|uniref:hypothetical protein n=1 Tax=Pandoraea iniqua TaxID=2508288 RepID=UPI0012401CF0|nr:hypothetical protein [Pandoraea iniqua]VVD95870.1 hypothetical protein PIN31009_01871 [Pandoraea iniqua]